MLLRRIKSQRKKYDSDELQDYISLLFKLTLLHKNLDTALDMGDGERSVRSTKYELPIYNRTRKVKYVSGSIHLSALTSGVLEEEQCKRLVAIRFVNVQGGRNNNIALDEYLEILNRESKIACSGHQTKKKYYRAFKGISAFSWICATFGVNQRYEPKERISSLTKLP